MISKDEVYQRLKEVYDPGLGVNVVDLGLIYSVEEPELMSDEAREQLYF